MICAGVLALTHDSQLSVSSAKSPQSHLSAGEFPGWMGFGAKLFPELALRVIHCSGVKLEYQPVCRCSLSGTQVNRKRNTD